MRRYLALLATFVALAPFAAAAIADTVRSVDHRWGDLALIELATDDVGSHPVLLGPYSRFGWHHPGPALFYLLALPYRLSGASSFGISIGGAIITGAAAAGIAWIAYRRGGRPLLLWTLVVVSLFVYATGRVVADVWNPWVTILPFALTVLLAWSVACRDLWAFPALVGVASFVVQTHVAYLPTVLVVSGAGIVIAVLALARDKEGHQRRRQATAVGLVAAAVAAALWVLPVVEQFAHEPGNVGNLVSYWRDSESEHGFRQSLDVASAEVGVIAGTAVGNRETPGRSSTRTWHWTALLSAAALAAAAAIAVRRRWWDLLALATLTGAAWLVAAYSLTRVTGSLLLYLTAWVAALGIPLWITAGVAVIRLGVDEPPRRWMSDPKTKGAVLIATLLVLVGLAIANIDGLSAEPERGRRAAIVDHALDVADEAVAGSECGPIRVRIGNGGKWLAWAVILRLEREGVDVAAERTDVTELHLDDWYLIDPADEGTVLIAGHPRGGDQLDDRLRVVEYACPDRDQSTGTRPARSSPT